MSASAGQRWLAVVGLSACLRLLLTSTTLPDVLMHRNELATPLTSWTRLQEGHYLATKLHQNPYVRGSFHQSPLLLLLGPLTDAHSTPAWLSHVVWLLCDICTAQLLANVANRRKRAVSVDQGEQAWLGWTVAAIYFLHPFTIGTALARSTIVFSNLFVAWSISGALEGHVVLATFSLSLATHISLYPALLLPPLLLLANSKKNKSLIATVFLGASAFVSHQTAVLALSRWATGSWDFVTSVYKVTLTVPDLTPTIGLGWYFFIEMFDHFRAFFVGAFQIHVFIYVAPLTYVFRRDPLFAVVLLVGVISIFKSYPSLGDFALWHALLATYSELGAHIARPLFLVCLMMYSLCLLPTFHHLWLYSGSGNANFFYASTLVWTVSQILVLVETLSAYGKRTVLATMDETGRRKVRQGKWVIVQR